jgi:cystathionine gamma-synthase
MAAFLLRVFFATGSFPSKEPTVHAARHLDDMLHLVLGKRIISTISIYYMDSWRSRKTKPTGTRKAWLSPAHQLKGRGNWSKEPHMARPAFGSNKRHIEMVKIQSPKTIAASSAIAEDPAFRAIAPPLYLSSSFEFDGFAQPASYEYSRTKNPTREQLAKTLARLEGGADAIVVASGMAAIDLVLSRLTIKGLVVAPHDCYAGTRRLLRQRSDKGHFRVIFVDQNNGNEMEEALGDRPELILVETPSNPLMRIVDIADIAVRAKAVGAELAVDNTFLSPALQNPIELGADFVIHSTTKYLNGHSDVVGGAVIAASSKHATELANWANVAGVTGSPFDAYQTLRGLRTLFPRIEHQQKSAASIAAFLEGHEQVAAVFYPGLASHPNHDLARRQQRGFGAMMSFELRGDRSEIERFAESVRIFSLAESLGGVESLLAHPATMTHAGLTSAEKRQSGITDSLFRLSIGLEDERDLIDDLVQAFASARAVSEVRPGVAAPSL